MCTTIGILPQHKERYRLMKRIEEYDELLVATSDGEEITIENNIDSVASAICKYGLMGDITVNTEDYIVLNTFGIYVDRCCDSEYMEKLRPALVAKQLEIEAEAFADNEDEMEL